MDGMSCSDVRRTYAFLYMTRDGASMCIDANGISMSIVGICGIRALGGSACASYALVKSVHYWHVCYWHGGTCAIEPIRLAHVE